jgi:hypothetical protein
MISRRFRGVSLSAPMENRHDEYNSGCLPHPHLDDMIPFCVTFPCENVTFQFFSDRRARSLVPNEQSPVSSISFSASI